MEKWTATWVLGRQQSRCYGNECPHSQYPQEVKKIYLREVAVGTDTDFSEDSCQVERSRRASFTNNYFQPSAYQQPYQTVPNHKNCNQSNYNRSTRSKPTKSISKPQNGIAVNNDNRNGKQQIKPRVIEANQKSVDESEYTPVPVRQLIQEFEKTCRPALQYKHISPKVIPIDNDIARFFETRNAPVKYEEEGEEDEEEDEEEEDNEYERVNPRNGNGYVSTDDTECTTDEDSSGSPLNSFSIIPPASRQTASSTMSTGERDFYAIFSEDFANRRRSSTSQELENLYRNNDDKYANSEQELPVQAKSLLLSMVASQEDILDTIKHLRSTPVLDNLLASSTPDCKFTDLYPKLTDAGKLYENETYKGPKIASINNLANYNTAPRGWDQSLTYYRPIKFEKPQEIVYSDF
ncbi:uncharacterized protein [Prorops nasuta]|uniref:uncharacterized protein n=1 Tax=Prorops nasuta TaxID=863751 RepID=UPI0034CFE7F2